MKMIKWMSVAVIIAIVIGLSGSLKMWHDLQYSKTLVIEGTPVFVSVYKLPKPLRIDMLFKGGMDLDAYPWIRPLLFQVNAFELTIPESEWPKYVDVEWTKERYEAAKSYAVRMTKEIEANPGHWGGVYNELTHFVWCKQGDIEMLSFWLIAKKTNGDVEGGSRYRLLHRVAGTWKISAKLSSKEQVRIIGEANERAMKAVEDGTLKVRSAKELNR